MKSIFTIGTLLIMSGIAHADYVPSPTETSVSGEEATKIANLFITGGDEKGTYAKGVGKISCVQKTDEKDFTCTVKKVIEK